LERQKSDYWDQINKLKKEIEGVEMMRKKAHEAKKEFQMEEDKEENKKVTLLNNELKELYRKRDDRRELFKIGIRAYEAQQSQIATYNWIAKQKEKLIKIRLKEDNLKKIERDKCQKLLEACANIQTQYTHIQGQEEDDKQMKEVKKDTKKDKENAKKKKQDKKKKTKKKKAEALIGALELDSLREHFEHFSIPPPKERKDISQAVDLLQFKLKELDNKPLTSTVGYGPGDTDSDTQSVNSVSLSP